MASGVELEYYDITLEEFIPYFIEHMEAQLSPSTIRTNLQAINSKEIGIRKFFGDKKMRLIKTLDVQNYVRFLEKHKTAKDNKPMSPKSIRNYVYVLSSMFEYAMKVGYMERKQNPCRYVELPKKVQPEIQVYTADEAKEVLQILAAEGDIMLEFAVNLAIGCGLRRSEIAAIKISDFDFQKSLLNISRAMVYGKGVDIEKETKTKSGDVDALGVLRVLEAVRKVQKYKMKCRTKHPEKYHESEYLYVDEFGRNLHVSTTTNRWLKWRQKHPEIKKTSFHALRHTYCSLMLTYGIDPRTLADLMGHSSAIISLNTYAHSYTETKQTYVNSLNDALYASVK